MSLCPEHEQRAAMTDDEFWDHVFPADEYEVDDGDLEEQAADQCPECRSIGACAYDSEGRALIHIPKEED